MLQDSRPTFLPGCAALGLSLAIWYVAGSTGSVLHGQPNPAVVGQWSTVQTWPVVSVHATLLPTGKVLFNSYADDPRLCVTPFERIENAEYVFACADRVARRRCRIVVESVRVCTHDSRHARSCINPRRIQLFTEPKGACARRASSS